MYNETLVSLEKEDYIDYLICVCGYSVEHARSMANIMYDGG